MLSKHGYLIKDLFININDVLYKYATLFYDNDIEFVSFNRDIIGFKEICKIYNEYAYELDYIEHTILVDSNINFVPEHDYSVHMLIIHIMKNNDNISEYFKTKFEIPILAISFLNYFLIPIHTKLNYYDNGWRTLFVNNQLSNISNDNIAKFLHLYDWTYVRNENKNYVMYISDYHIEEDGYKLDDIHLFQLLYCLRVIHKHLQISKLKFKIVSITLPEKNGLNVYVIDETEEYGTYIFTYHTKNYTIIITEFTDSTDYISDDYKTLSLYLKQPLDQMSIKTMFNSYNSLNIQYKNIVNTYNINNIITYS
jgi:hypothetical protein